MSFSRSICLFGTSAFFLIACAGAPVPSERIASAEAAIRAAREGGASSTPGAALHLHYAELERVEAERIASGGDSEFASMQFRRAEADANLALALVRESNAERAARMAGEALNSLAH